MSSRVASGASIALILVAVPVAVASTKTTTTWTDPGLQPRTYAKVLVLAKVTEESAKRTLEDAVVKGLQDQDIPAIPAYSYLVPADLESEDSIRAKAKSLGVDAGIVFTVTDFKEAEIVAPPKGSVSVGIGGGWGGFLGGSVPIGGNTLETVRQVALKGEFYAAGTPSPVWMANYTTDLKNGVDGEARLIAKDTIRYLKKAKIFAKPKD